MAIDPQELAAVLEEFRLAHGNETKEKAAERSGIGIRQYRRISNAHEPNPRAATLEKLANANGVQVGWLMDRITHGDNTLTGRLQRLEDEVAQIHQAVDQILDLWKIHAPHALAQVEAEAQLAAAARSTAKSSSATGRQRRAS